MWLPCRLLDLERDVFITPLKRTHKNTYYSPRCPFRPAVPSKTFRLCGYICSDTSLTTAALWYGKRASSSGRGRCSLLFYRRVTFRWCGWCFLRFSGGWRWQRRWNFRWWSFRGEGFPSVSNGMPMTHLVYVSVDIPKERRSGVQKKSSPVTLSVLMRRISSETHRFQMYASLRVQATNIFSHTELFTQWWWLICYFCVLDCCRCLFLTCGFDELTSNGPRAVLLSTVIWKLGVSVGMCRIISL